MFSLRDNSPHAWVEGLKLLSFEMKSRLSRFPPAELSSAGWKELSAILLECREEFLSQGKNDDAEECLLVSKKDFVGYVNLLHSLGKIQEKELTYLKEHQPF